jgi:hypothetical protein
MALKYFIELYMNSCFLCLLLNEVSHALQIVFSNSIRPEMYRSTTTNLAAATVTVTVATTTTNLTATTATAVAKATATAFALTNVTTTLFFSGWLSRHLLVCVAACC